MSVEGVVQGPSPHATGSYDSLWSEGRWPADAALGRRSARLFLNGQAKVQERWPKLADLKPGDKVAVAHDVAASKDRRVPGAGTERRRFGGSTLRLTRSKVQHEGDNAPTVTYTIGPKCAITLGRRGGPN